MSWRRQHCRRWRDDGVAPYEGTAVGNGCAVDARRDQRAVQSPCSALRAAAKIPVLAEQILLLSAQPPQLFLVSRRIPHVAATKLVNLHRCLRTMSAIGSLVFCTDCGNLLDGSTGNENAVLLCEVCGAQCKGTRPFAAKSPRFPLFNVLGFLFSAAVAITCYLIAKILGSTVGSKLTSPSHRYCRKEHHHPFQAVVVSFLAPRKAFRGPAAFRRQHADGRRHQPDVREVWERRGQILHDAAAQCRRRHNGLLHLRVWSQVSRA